MADYRYRTSSCVYDRNPHEGRAQRESIQEAMRSCTTPGPLMRLRLLYRCYRRPCTLPVETDMQASRGTSAQGAPGRAASPPAAPSTGAVKAPPPARLPGCDMFHEELPQMSSGRPAGGRQAARRTPDSAECHSCQASDPATQSMPHNASQRPAAVRPTAVRPTAGCSE